MALLLLAAIPEATRCGLALFRSGHYVSATTILAEPPWALAGEVGDWFSSQLVASDGGSRVTLVWEGPPIRHADVTQAAILRAESGSLIAGYLRGRGFDEVSLVRPDWRGKQTPQDLRARAERALSQSGMQPDLTGVAVKYRAEAWGAISLGLTAMGAR